MFPLVHYFVNRQIFENVSPLMTLGGIFPDLAAAAGMDRDTGHTMGKDLYDWCKKEAPQGLDLARGIISHGTEPHGVDHYADEYFSGYKKGWCFLQGERYMQQVAAVTHLPDDLIWWKSHNFVEISYELLTAEKYPELIDDLLKDIYDQDAICCAAKLLSRYSGIKEADFTAAFENIPNIFALKDMSPLTLAEKQNNAFMVRHKIFDGDVPGMADLFCIIRDDLRAGYDSFFTPLIKKIAVLLSGY